MFKVVIMSVQIEIFRPSTGTVSATHKCMVFTPINAWCFLFFVVVGPLTLHTITHKCTAFMRLILVRLESLTYFMVDDMWCIEFGLGGIEDMELLWILMGSH